MIPKYPVTAWTSDGRLPTTENLPLNGFAASRDISGIKMKSKNVQLQQRVCGSSCIGITTLPGSETGLLDRKTIAFMCE